MVVKAKTMQIIAKNGEYFEFRQLTRNDGELLGKFFDNLSDNTRSKFGPHPLTADYAINKLCPALGKDNVLRFVVSSAEQVVGYFIVDFNDYPNEKQRYITYGIDLEFPEDPVIAPCIADAYQSQGIASQAMANLISYLKAQGVRSLILMGGTQAPNIQARNFYKKFGFLEYGEFFTEHNGLNNFDMRLVL